MAQGSGMLNLSIGVRNLDRVAEQLGRLSGVQARTAYANAINDAAKRLQAQMRKELAGVFDRPSRFIVNSPKYVPATADKLSARVLPTLDARNLPSKGGKVGVDPQKVLQAQEFGGSRRDKRSEVALRRAGFLPPGFQTAIPRVPFPGSDDGLGNLRGAFVAQLISFLQASPEQGYRQNMTKRSKARLRNQQGIGNIATKKVYKTTLGVRYFVSYGRLRGGHLAPGIWAAKGTHDVEVKPVLMFVRAASYAPRLSMERIAENADLQEYLDKRVRFHIREAAGV